jgi:hypothetical protein
MKIPGKLDSVASEAVRVSLTNQKGVGQERAAKNEAPLTDSQDRVRFGIGRAIQSALDPTAISAEREARKAELMRLVQSGEYKMPSSQDLAAKVGEELTLEILTLGTDK